MYSLRKSFIGNALTVEFTIQFTYPKISLLFHPSDTRPGIAFMKRQYSIVVKSSYFIPHYGTHQPSDILCNQVIYFIYLPSIPPPPHRLCEDKDFCLIFAEIQILALPFYQVDNILNLSVPQIHHLSSENNSAHLNVL